MPVKVTGDVERVEAALGSGGNVEIVPVFIPISTYQVLLEEGRKRGIPVGDVFANAVSMYINSSQKSDINQDEEISPPKPARKIDLFVGKTRK